jgi:hypothetical protein
MKFVLSVALEISLTSTKPLKRLPKKRPYSIGTCFWVIEKMTTPYSSVQHIADQKKVREIAACI